MAAKIEASRFKFRKNRRQVTRLAPDRELKPEIGFFKKPEPPLPPVQTTLTPTGKKMIRAGKLQANVLPGDSRLLGKPFETGPSIY